MSQVNVLKSLSNAASFIEMQRRLDAMEGDSYIVNALQCLLDSIEALTAEVRMEGDSE